jgi:electron transfer flavoprotein alpha/beta subunit
LKANHAEIPTYDASTLNLDASTIGVKGSKTTVGSSYFPEHNKNCVKVSGSEAEEVAKNLVSLLRNAKVM